MPSPKPAYIFVLPWEIHFPGGVNEVVRNLAREFSIANLNSVVASLQWNKSESSPDARPDNLWTELHWRLREPITRERPWRSLCAFVLHAPLDLYRLRRRLRRLHTVVVNFHYPTLAAWSVLLLRKSRLIPFRLLLSFHGQDLNDAERSPWYLRRLWQILIRQVDGVTACSEALARRVEDFSGRAVTAVHNGAQEQAVQPLAPQWSALLANKISLLCVATYEHKKGLDILLRAFAPLALERPQLNLVLIGREAPAYDALQKLIVDLGIRAQVLCLRNLDNAQVQSFYPAAEIFVLPSRAEPFGIVLLEAGLHALPVIASRVDGIPEIISAPTLGRLVEAEDVAGLRAAITELLDTPDERQRLGQALQKHVRASFSWPRAAEQYLRLGGLR